MKLLILAALAAVLPAGTLAAEREVTVGGGAAPLYATLLTPEGAKPGPAVLLIAGSGPTDRDGNSTIPSVQPATLKLIAEDLARSGVPSLRYDKRGIGKSRAAIASEREMRFDGAVDDAVAFARLLKAEPGVRCVVILGHSEGALIAVLAAQKVETCGVISVAGSGRPLGKVLREQLAGAGLPAPTLAVADKILVELEAGREVPGIPATDPLFRPSVQPYVISQVSIDPVKALAAVKTPVLILQGETDLQVGVADARALAAGKPEATLVILPGVNHVLKAAPMDRAANITAYANPALPLGPGVSEAINAFVAKAP